MSPTFVFIVSFIISAVYGYSKWNVTNKKYNVVMFTTTYHSGQFNISGYRPEEEGSYPLHIYVIGTGDNTNAWNNKAQTYTSYMASRGFISASLWYDSVDYPSSCIGNNGFLAKAQLMFDVDNPQSAINVLCTSSSLDIDCNSGVVLNGMSQGANLVSLSGLFAGTLITAISEMGGGNSVVFRIFDCLNYENLGLPQSKIRSRVGQNDAVFCGNPPNNDGCRIQQT
eukprot:UN11028